MIPKNWRYSRGDIYYANMEPHVGSEQGGERPVVVLQNDKGNKHSRINGERECDGSVTGRAIECGWADE